MYPVILCVQCPALFGLFSHIMGWLHDCVVLSVRTVSVRSVGRLAILFQVSRLSCQFLGLTRSNLLTFTSPFMMYVGDLQHGDRRVEVVIVQRIRWNLASTAYIKQKLRHSPADKKVPGSIPRWCRIFVRSTCFGVSRASKKRAPVVSLEKLGHPGPGTGLLTSH